MFNKFFYIAFTLSGVMSLQANTVPSEVDKVAVEPEKDLVAIEKAAAKARRDAVEKATLINKAKLKAYEKCQKEITLQSVVKAAGYAFPLEDVLNFEELQETVRLEAVREATVKHKTLVLAEFVDQVSKDYPLYKKGEVITVRSKRGVPYSGIHKGFRGSVLQIGRKQVLFADLDLESQERLHKDLRLARIKSAHSVASYKILRKRKELSSAIFAEKFPIALQKSSLINSNDAWLTPKAFFANKLQAERKSALPRYEQIAEFKTLTEAGYELIAGKGGGEPSWRAPSEARRLLIAAEKNRAIPHNQLKPLTPAQPFRKDF